MPIEEEASLASHYNVLQELGSGSFGTVRVKKMAIRDNFNDFLGLQGY